MFQRDDKHHHEKQKRIEPFRREPPDLEIIMSDEGLEQLVPTGDGRGHIQQTGKHKDKGKPVANGTHAIVGVARALATLFHCLTP